MFGNSAWKTQEPGFLEVFLRKQIMFWLEKKQGSKLEKAEKLKVSVISEDQARSWLSGSSNNE
jgi:hypothetical protein